MGKVKKPALLSFEDTLRELVVGVDMSVELQITNYPIYLSVLKNYNQQPAEAHKILEKIQDEYNKTNSTVISN